jgi:hypothetical protein
MIFTLFLLIKNFLYKLALTFLKKCIEIKNQVLKIRALKFLIPRINFLIPGIRIRLLLLFILSAIGTSYLVFKKTNNKQYLHINIFIWLVYLLSMSTFIYDQQFLSMSIYLVAILVSLLIIFKHMKFDTYLMASSFWFLFGFTIISLYMTILSINNYYINYFREGPMGDKGEKGKEGESGKKSIDYKDSKLCLIQIEHYVNQIYYKWNLKNGLDSNNKINNLYILDQIKRICKSNDFKKKIYSVGVVNTINNFKKKIKDWIFYILEYDNGKKFLDNYFLIDTHWVDLISENDKYNRSPFIKITKDPVWNWGNCKKNYQKNDNIKKNSRNKCKK